MAPASKEVSKEFAIKLTAIYGIAIPLILRQGETSAKASIEEPALNMVAHTLQFHLNRSGNQSLFGDVQASLISVGSPKVLAEAKGLAVYLPNTSRHMTLALPPDKSLPSGSRIRITFTLPPQDGGVLLAETYLTVP